jgi:20S proteasome alpha/beta subunit
MKKPPLLMDQQKAQIFGDEVPKPLAIAEVRQHPSRHLPPLLAFAWRKRERYRVTILAGMICKHAIVVGADSRLTDLSDGSTEDVDKINVVDFGDNHVLVAEGGVPSVTNRIVGTMREKATDVRISKWQDVTQIMEESIRDVKSKLDEEQKQLGRDYPSSLLIAFYANNRPYLFTCNNVFGIGIAEVAKRHFAAVGVGKSLADYLLSEFVDVDAKDELRLMALIYTILKVKDSNGLCGGPTRIKTLQLHYVGLDSPYRGQVNPLYPPRFINRIEKELKNMDAKTKEPRNTQIISALQRAIKKFSLETHWQA